MKIIKILLSFIFCVLPLTEALGEGFVTIDFGTSKKEATEHFITMWGQPDIVNDEAIVFLNKDYRGFRFNKIIIGFENKTMLGTGIIGSQPNMWLLKEMMDYYSKRPFTDKNGNIDTTTNVQILVHILEKHGFIKQNSEQNIQKSFQKSSDFSAYFVNTVSKGTINHGNERSLQKICQGNL